ncbi:MAG: MBL fold metallo-hydrolase [Alphaproteobacteria bacterium]|nr:MAG: MBL fold metallo-hydrolase [Alphaproteobacteria bacterium]
MTGKGKEQSRPQPGSAEAVTRRVRRVLADNPGPFTHHGTATFLVGAGRDLAVIDPGPQHEAHLDALIAAIGGRHVSYILVTHTHRDHSPLARALAERTGAPILAFGPHGAGARRLAPKIADLMPEGEFEAGADWNFRPDVMIGDDARIVGDGWMIRAIHTPGHAANHLCFSLEEEGILFTGDHVMGWSTSVIAPPDGDMAAYMCSLERLLGRDQDRLYLPTHGPVIREPHAHVRQLLHHRRLREAAIRRLLAEMQEASIADLVLRIYPELDPRLYPAAAASTLAHLIALIEEGKVMPVSPSDDGSLDKPDTDATLHFPAWAFRRFLTARMLPETRA